MTPDEINRAIAERVGWIKETKEIEHTCGYQWTEVVTRWRNPSGAQVLSCPNYSSSLDAIHEALNSLDDSELRRYTDEVCELAYDGTTDPDIQQLLTMEAAELAACYVRAIGKWRGA